LHSSFKQFIRASFPGHAGAGEPALQPATGPLRVLVVDDASEGRKLVRAQLEAEGHFVLEAADGLEALCLLTHEKVQAVISDILMPRMDGYRLCSEIRRNQKLAALPIIIYTSTYTSAADEQAALDLGADRFLRKPCPAKELLGALLAVVTSPPLRDPKRAAPVQDLAAMKQYNERLVAKLEEKNLGLEAQAESLRETQAQLRKLNEDLEQRVRDSTTRLEVANRELEAFSRSVSHDLRSPLRQIEHSAEFLAKSGDDAEKSRQCLDAISQSSQRMARLLDDLVLFPGTDRTEPRRENVDLPELVREVVAELQSTPALSVRKIEWISGPLPQVHADRSMLRQVLVNLLGNAVKFTRSRGRAKIETGCAPGNPGEPVIFIRDNGVGFDMEYFDKLFGVFQRLHSQANFEGTGIGLAKVRYIIERHGGRFWAESKVNSGATFFFSLPSREQPA
jgi:signal transduction histidine kinase